MSDFKNKSLEDRLHEFKTIRKNHPDKIPIICEKAKKSTISEQYSVNLDKDIDKHKFLVPEHFSMGQFSYIIRRRLNISQEEALFIYVNNNKIISSSQSLISVYEENKSQDGFLYIQYGSENTFG